MYIKSFKIQDQLRSISRSDWIGQKIFTEEKINARRLQQLSWNCLYFQEKIFCVNERDFREEIILFICAILSSDTGICSAIHFSSFLFRHSFYYSFYLAFLSSFRCLSSLLWQWTRSRNLPSSAVIHKTSASTGIEISYLTLKKSWVKSRSTYNIGQY